MQLFSSKKSELEATDSHTHSHEEHPLAEIVRFSIIAILIVVPIRMFIAQPFIVSGASMENTFHSGEYLIVDQITYHFEEPTRGEVIIFRYPRDPSKFFIKRVIGTPGDTVTIEGNTVTIINADNPNGIVLKEPYIKSMAPGARFEETLGEREYFVMGDNRDESSDSRSWGVLQRERIVGRAFLRLFPPQEFDYLPGAVPRESISSS
ncbi:MAG: signal peptidase I [Patescibacteria group bacterium]